MGKIVLLDDETINKIAAGEVVDRPASIVKELVENSIDAGASHINIEIKNGGITYIKISDDGKGIASDDVMIAFERHATSKIRKESDILKISSMGFRGEALASIASISKVTMETKSFDEYTGTKVVFEGGVNKLQEEIPFSTGTSITVENIFYNVPARYKFLKKDSTEAGYIEEIVTKIALSHKEISFKYINNNKVIFMTSGNSNLKETVLSIFGKEYALNVLDVDFKYENMSIVGAIGLPTIARGTRQNEFTFVNTRYIKNKTIQTAIEKAYEQNINIGKYPFVILDIKMDPKEVDVNVHPAKLEVKFEKESEIFNLVYLAIKDRLTKYHQETSPFYVEKVENINEEKETSVKYTQPELIISNLEYKKPELVNINEKVEYVKYEPVKTEYISKVNEEERVTYVEEENIIEIADTITEDIELKKIIEPEKYKYIGSTFDTYIIIEIKDKMYIIDQHAAHERLIYERIKEMYYSKNKETQLLLIPTLIELTNIDKQLVIDNIAMFEEAGYIIEDFAGNEIKISGVPNIGYNMDFKDMFTDMVDILKGSVTTEKEDKEKRFIYTLACKAAVKANMKLSKEEHIALIDNMMKLDRPFTCPHGRPTAIEMTKYEIERKFARK